MNYKNTISVTILSAIAIAIVAIVSVAGFGIHDSSEETFTQPAKFMFVEGVSPSVTFKFRDATESMPFQTYTQTGGFTLTTMTGTTKTKQTEPTDTVSRSKPAFLLEKIAGGTPYLYEAADEAQNYQNTAGGFEFPYKYFDATVWLSQGGTDIRTFEYHDCQVKAYAVTTRSDNEEGYTGKGFAVVDQFTFECDGYIPHNPLLEHLNISESAKTISSSDLKSTNQWESGFKKP